MKHNFACSLYVLVFSNIFTYIGTNNTTIKFNVGFTARMNSRFNKLVSYINPSNFLLFLRKNCHMHVQLF